MPLSITSPQELSTHLATFLDHYAQNHRFPYLRENPSKFGQRLGSMLWNFQLEHQTPLPAIIFETKALYSFWNILIDDLIDQLHDHQQAHQVIQECLSLLGNFQRHKDPSTLLSHEVSIVFLDLLKSWQKIPSPHPNTLYQDLFYVDLTAIVNGIEAERIMQQSNTHNLEEYLEFAARTHDIRLLLDIDLQFLPLKISPSTLSQLRQAYKHFSLAFKISADLATYHREQQEKSLNILSLIANHQQDPLQNTPQAQKLSDQYWQKSKQLLSQIKSPDLTPLIQGFQTMLKSYQGQVNFTPPQNSRL